MMLSRIAILLIASGALALGTAGCSVVEECEALVADQRECECDLEACDIEPNSCQLLTDQRDERKDACKDAGDDDILELLLEIAACEGKKTQCPPPPS
jgi:hypothetical protein